MVPKVMSSDRFFALAWGWAMAMTPLTKSGKLKRSSLRTILPLSILPMSNTSLMRLRRCRDDDWMRSRQAAMRSGSCRWAFAMVVRPTMAFMGVRMSWDMLERNCDFAALAVCARESASRRSALRRSSRLRLRYMSARYTASDTATPAMSTTAQPTVCRPLSVTTL